jgi:hypothetical protein
VTGAVAAGVYACHLVSVLSEPLNRSSLSEPVNRQVLKDCAKKALADVVHIIANEFKVDSDDPNSVIVAPVAPLKIPE